jgi:hypothetical protein
MTHEVPRARERQAAARISSASHVSVVRLGHARQRHGVADVLAAVRDRQALDAAVVRPVAPRRRTDALRIQNALDALSIARIADGPARDPRAVAVAAALAAHGPGLQAVRPGRARAPVRARRDACMTGPVARLARGAVAVAAALHALMQRRVAPRKAAVRALAVLDAGDTLMGRRIAMQSRDGAIGVEGAPGCSRDRGASVRVEGPGLVAARRRHRDRRPKHRPRGEPLQRGHRRHGDPARMASASACAKPAG